MTLLICGSLDEGVLVYEFRFKEVVGLSGAAALALSPAGDFVYVASEDDKALTVLAIALRYDMTQRRGSHFRQIQVCVFALSHALTYLLARACAVAEAETRSVRACSLSHSRPLSLARALALSRLLCRFSMLLARALSRSLLHSLSLSMSLQL
jgi:hypothetical protein